MPNWCINGMTVKGDPERIAEFIEEQKGLDYDHEGTVKGETALTFETAVPMPRMLKGRKSPSDDDSMTWYDWSVENWATKWDACSSAVDYKSGKDFAFYQFDTAWSPPVTWFEKMVQFYPWLDFEIEWEEPGMGFAGKLAATKGITGTMEEWDIVWDEEADKYVKIAD